ncbi:MAG TPA: methylmalonyl-CoA mutase family protein [Candidatus Limnocylindrales bacterium]
MHPVHLLARAGHQLGHLGLDHGRAREDVVVLQQVGLESQPENNVYRILIEMLAVTLSRDARARAVQLPAWNEALGLPRPWDQQWSIRMQQILAYETDLLEDPDILDGSKAIRRKVDELKGAAKAELARIEAMGGAIAAIDYMKQALVESNTERVRRIEAGEQIVVGVNRWTETEPSPLSTGEGLVVAVDAGIEIEQVEKLNAWRAARDAKAVTQALAALERAAREGGNVMEPSIACARAGVTTGEWGSVLRAVFGEYRAPTGVARGAAASGEASLTEVRAEVERVSAQLGRRIKLLVGKPGLDGHSNGAEQIAVRARDCGMEVVYEGIRLTPAQIVRTAVDEAVHVVGLSILSGSHVPLVADVLERLRQEGLDDIPVVVGGIVPPEDAATLKGFGVAAVYTPKDFQLDAIMRDIAHLAAGAAEAA